MRFLLKQEVPVATFALSGETPLTHIINTMPSDVAEMALNQIIVKDLQQKKTKYYLANITSKRWTKLCIARNRFNGVTFAKDPLEVVRQFLSYMAHKNFIYP